MRAAHAALVAAALGAGCIASPGNIRPQSECSDDGDCNGGAGEVCDEGVCWGDPPPGAYAAVLGPASSYNSIAATAELPSLMIDPAGWIHDASGNPLTLNAVVRVTGEVRTPCPPQLEGCVDVLRVPGQLRWSRPSRIPGLPDVPVSATITGPFENGGGRAGFELFLPRATEPTTYTVTFTPSTMPLGAGLPSPAKFLPPFRTEVVVDPADEALVRDFTLPTPGARTISGRITQIGATALDGWRVRAEAGDGTVQGVFTLVSNLAVTSPNGDFTLAIVDDPDLAVVDLVLDPPDAGGTANDGERARVRLRDHVITSPLPTLALPRIERLIAAPIVVEGVDGSGSVNRVTGASVRARLDQRIGDVFLQHEADATTADGVASLQVLLGSTDLPLHYEIDVLPGPLSEMASIYGIDLDVEDVVPEPPAITLPSGVPLVGTVFDDLGYAVAGAAVSASVSAATLCELSSEHLRVARGLAPVQTATDANGEFKLYVDRDLDGVPLSFDITIEPSAGTWSPRWTFVGQEVSSDHQSLWLPAAAHVRAVVLDPSSNPAPDTVVTLYEMTEDPAPCPQVAAFGESGLAVRRAVGSSDSEGVVRLILPRLASY